jgi:hypothetical protein
MVIFILLSNVVEGSPRRWFGPGWLDGEMPGFIGLGVASPQLQELDILVLGEGRGLCMPVPRLKSPGA